MCSVNIALELTTTCQCWQVYSRLVQMMRGQRRILDCAHLGSSYIHAPLSEVSRSTSLGCSIKGHVALSKTSLWSGWRHVYAAASTQSCAEGCYTVTTVSSHRGGCAAADIDSLSKYLRR